MTSVDETAEPANSGEMNRLHALIIGRLLVVFLLLVTWLGWRTGDLTSPYITLYFVLISISSLFFSANSTLAMSMISGGLFSALALLTSLAVVPGFGSQYTTAKVIQIVTFNLVALLVVGFLAARLAARRHPGEQLAETTRTLARPR